MKLQINMGEEIADDMTEALENIAIDSIKGMRLDVRV